MKKQIFIFAIIAIAFSSCKNLVPYTDSLQAKHNWSTEQLKNTQFYLSSAICLERELTKDMPDQIIGKIVVKQGIRKEVIYLRKGLPITFVGETGNGSYVMQCETGDGKTLTFGVDSNSNGKFTLLASAWKNGFGLIHYSGAEFFVPIEEAESHLLVDLRKLTNVHNKYHKAKGVKVKVKQN